MAARILSDSEIAEMEKLTVDRLVEAIEGDVVAADDSRVWSWSRRWRCVGGAA